MRIHRPYRLWHHTHTFEAAGPGTRMADSVRYALPGWPAGELALDFIK